MWIRLLALDKRVILSYTFNPNSVSISGISQETKLTFFMYEVESVGILQPAVVYLFQHIMTLRTEDFCRLV